MSDFKDRCGGCEHTTGYDLPFKGARTITQCALGYRVPISEGCSEFTPDITASCDRCFFYTKKESEGRYKPHCTVHNITSIMSKNFPGGSGFCQEFYQRNSYENTNKEKKSGCFIATAVYNSPTAPKVMILREFRDNILLQSKYGKSFVNQYYKYSPNFADFLRGHKILKSIVRYIFIEPLVFIVKLFQKKRA